jgi:hypothetical protein
MSQLQLAEINLDGFARIEQLADQLDSFCLQPGDDEAEAIKARAMLAYKVELARCLANHYQQQAETMAGEL